MPYFNKTEIMKNILRRIRCGLLWGGLLACTGCNQEVFVDRIAPAETHFTLDGNGDTLVIDFPSEDWSVLDVTSESGKSLISFVSSDNGGPVTKMEDRERLEFSLGGLLDCAVVRDEGRRLVVMLGENLLQEDYRMDIHVGNDYVDIPLEFRLTLGEPYRVDSVVYRLEPDSPWTEVREGEGLVVYNQSADTIRQQLVMPLPYEGYRLRSFSLGNGTPRIISDAVAHDESIVAMGEYGKSRRVRLTRGKVIVSSAGEYDDCRPQAIRSANL